MAEGDTPQTKLNECWNAIEEEYAFVELVNEKGSFQITADQIKEHREPRLVTKFDHENDLPDIFRDNNLSILPVRRGTYLISKMKTFQNVDGTFDDKVRYMPIPPYLESICPDGISSEAVALNAAYSAGIIENFLDEEELVPTISGRQGSGCFNFRISAGTEGDIPISVSNTQIEIDAGYEGLGSLALVEAKMGLAQDFMLRQLYYPFRTWSAKIEKPVRPIFLTFTNSMFYLFEYEFSDPMVYNSARIKKSARYSIEPIDISQDQISYAYENTAPVKDNPTIPPIQANSIERVLDLCNRLDKKPLKKAEITSAYGFDSRQTDYYLNAGRYLGLIEQSNKDKSFYTLSVEGKKYAGASETEARILICKLIFRHEIFREMYALMKRNRRYPTNKETVEFIKKHTSLSGGTPARRASSYLSWLHWIINLNSEESTD